jgi:uncharacterized protein (TIGR00369 family)
MADKGLIISETGAQRLIGYVLDLGAGDGRARCRLGLTHDHLNRHGVLHGGLSATLLDNAMSATASLTVDTTGRAPFLTVSLNVHYLAGANLGATVIASGRVTGGGKSLLFLDGDLRDDADRLIATATGVFKRVPPDRLQKGTGAGDA